MTQLIQDSDIYVWDIEANETATKVWCLSVNDGHTTELFSDHDSTLRSLSDGLGIISGADLWVGHNLIAYDWQVITKLYPWVKPPKKIYDTLIMSRIIFAEPQRFPISKQLSPKDKYSHSLKAWGLRLGNHKGDYAGGWDQYSKEMGDYCVQDTELTRCLYNYQLNSVNYSVIDWDNEYSPVNTEYQFAMNIARQVGTGFYFNEGEAHPIVSELSAKKVELTQQLQAVFPPIVSQVQLITKVRTDVTPFNPGSRIQIAERLQGLGWVPVKFTESTAKLAPHLRRAKVDPDSLLTCDLPEVKPILEYLEVDKRLGQIANGQNAWLKLVTPEGKIHGQVNTVGAVTSRVSHSRPNMSAVPRVGGFLGAECRNLFHARPGWSLIGADLAGIELRTLAHHTWSFDDGVYAEHVLNGDIHTVHQKAFGLPEGKEWRSIGKTGTYCLI